MKPCSPLTEFGLAAFVAPSDPACPDSRPLSLHPADHHTHSTAPLLSPPAVSAWPGPRAPCIGASSVAPTNTDPGTAAAACGGFVSSLHPDTRKRPTCVSLSTAHCVITAPNHDEASSSSCDHCANNLCGYSSSPY